MPDCFALVHGNQAYLLLCSFLPPWTTLILAVLLFTGSRSVLILGSFLSVLCFCWLLEESSPNSLRDFLVVLLLFGSLQQLTDHSLPICMHTFFDSQLMRLWVKHLFIFFNWNKSFLIFVDGFRTMVSPEKAMKAGIKWHFPLCSSEECWTGLNRIFVITFIMIIIYFSVLE